MCGIFRKGLTKKAELILRLGWGEVGNGMWVCSSLGEHFSSSDNVTKSGDGGSKACGSSKDNEQHSHAEADGLRPDLGCNCTIQRQGTGQALESVAFALLLVVLAQASPDFCKQEKHASTPRLPPLKFNVKMWSYF